MGWATVAALIEAEDVLAAVVLAQAQQARSRLIGAGEPGQQAVNVRFVKGSGRFREVGGAREGDLASVLDYYQSLSPRRLVVLGEPGAGKTVLALELLILLLESRPHDPCVPVPVLISVASYDTRLSWENWLARHIAQRFGVGGEEAGRLVHDGRALPMVDGRDEMDPAGNPGQAAALNVSMRGRQKAPVVSDPAGRRHLSGLGGGGESAAPARSPLASVRRASRSPPRSPERSDAAMSCSRVSLSIRPAAVMSLAAQNSG